MKLTQEHTKEWRILQAVKGVLVSVARETATAPGKRHQLSPQTVEDIKQCMGLISSREMELLGKTEELTSSRPKYADDNKKVAKVKLEQVLKTKPAKK